MIDAGAPAGSTRRTTYSDIPAGTVCTVTETSDGDTSTVAAEVSISDSPATIPGDGTATVGVSDTYTDISGQLVVNKTIAGDGAGHQGAVTIHVACTGVDASLTPDFTIPAGGSSDSTTYPGLPPGTPCTVTETADGAITGVVEVTTTGSPQAVTIPASGSVERRRHRHLHAGDWFAGGDQDHRGGGAAGLQGQIVMHVDCSDGVPRPDFVIAAGAPAGSTTSTTYADIPAGTVCTVTETSDGHTSTVAAEVSITDSPATIPGDGTATVGVSDTYTDISGQLVVNKTIAGDGAGHQGAVTIHVACTGVAATLTPDFTIPAGGSSDSTTYPGLPPGTPCTVTETANGAITGVVEVTTTGSPQAVTIPASGSVEADITDTYTRRFARGQQDYRRALGGPAGRRCDQGPLYRSPGRPNTRLPDTGGNSGRHDLIA